MALEIRRSGCPGADDTCCQACNKKKHMDKRGEDIKTKQAARVERQVQFAEARGGAGSEGEQQQEEEKKEEKGSTEAAGKKGSKDEAETGLKK
jgi:hypothetical protein